MGDYVAGARFGYLAKRRNQRSYYKRYLAALDVVIRAGAWPIIEIAIVEGHMPRDERGVSWLCTGLDELNRHFRKTGQLSSRPRTAPGCRPTDQMKRA